MQHQVTLHDGLSALVVSQFLGTDFWSHEPKATAFFSGYEEGAYRKVAKGMSLIREPFSTLRFH
jgi:hypothetical protein